MTGGIQPTDDAVSVLGRKILAVLIDPASWKPGLVHDILAAAKADRSSGETR